MHRIDTSTAQKDKFGAGKNGFTTGNAQTGVPPTEVSAHILDAFQEEICSVIESEGLTLDKSKQDQLLCALNKKISNVPSATIEKKGVVRLATDEEALLGQSIEAVMSAKSVADAVKEMLRQMFVGVPISWMLPEPPSWGISLSGQAINPLTDPLLASRYPSLRLPDARAAVVRGWDNGRGRDAGRLLLSEQDDATRKIIGRFSTVWGEIGSGENAFFEETVSGKGNVISGTSGNRYGYLGFDSSRLGHTADETRVFTVAMHTITMR